MAEIQSIADHSVTIAGETYSLLAIPDARSPLVQEQRQQVLRNIDLEKLVLDLELCKDLLYLAYNGVAGHGELTAAMTNFHFTFSKLCKDSALELENIQLQSAQILEKLKFVFTLLLRGQERSAIEFLKSCGTIADGLATQAKALAARFDDLSSEASKILGKTQVVQGQEEKDKLALQAQLQALEAQTVKAQNLVKGIAQQKRKLEELYQKAQEKAETHEQRAFVLSVIGAIFQPIAAGVGAFGAVYAGGAAGAAANKLNPAPAAPPAEETKAAAEKKQEAAKEKLAAAEQKQKDVEKKVEKAEGEKKVADTKLAEKATAEKEAAAAAAKAPADAALASALKLTQTEASAAKTVAGAAKQSVDTAKEELKTATEATTAARAAFEAAAKAVEKAGAALMQMGSDYAKIAEGYRQEKQEYLKMLMDKQDMEQELLASIQEYAVKMQHTGTSIQTVQLTCDSLFHAVGALKKVAVILQDASRFWDGMAAACRALANNDLQGKVNICADLPADLKREIMTSQDFKEQVVRYYASWKAIQVVSKEYAAATEDIRVATNKDFTVNLPIEQMRKTAVELGQRLAERTKQSVERNIAEKAELKREATTLEQAQPLKKAS